MTNSLNKKTILILTAIALLGGCGGGGSGPAPNIVPEVQVAEFGEVRSFSDHIEVDIRFPTLDTTLGGTLFLPVGQQAFATVVLQPGSQPWLRTTTADYAGSGADYYNSLGIAALSYDKRGGGQSGGICCQANIVQLAGDALAAVDAISLHPQVDVTRIGIDGVSQGGWVAVNAAARSADIDFVMSKVGPAVSTFEEEEYSRLTGDDDCVASGLTNEEIDAAMATVVPAGYDPRADLMVMNQPGLWLFGGLDTSIPTRQSIVVLEEIRTSSVKDWEILLQPDANHFMVINGGPCQMVGPLVNNAPAFESWLSRVLTNSLP